jgi:uncharacterized protein (UPF0333 family)
MKIFVRILILSAIGAGIFWCMHALGKGNLTSTDSALFSVVLTGLSILASWVVTEMYSSDQHKAAIEEVQEAHRTNLRTYGLKAAEKVTNLSNELNRLSTYLQQELDYTEYRNTEEELLAKEERLESAIHLINTLKSVNDTSLSDWQGVIGEELDEQREEKHERERELRMALAEMEEMLRLQTAELRDRQQPNQEIRAEMESLRRDLRLMVSAAGGVPVPFHRIAKTRHTIETSCPGCGAGLKYKQSASIKSVKAVRCTDCQSRFVARYDEKKGHYLLPREPTIEAFECPSCDARNEIPLDPVPSGSAAGECKSCGCGIIVIRSTDGVRVRLASQQILTRQALSEELIERVKKSLPPQPWPTGTHKKIALDLDVSFSTVSRAITELIKRGNFLPQEYGLLAEPDKVVGTTNH